MKTDLMNFINPEERGDINQMMKSDWKNSEGREEDRTIMKTGPKNFERRTEDRPIMKTGPKNFIDPEERGDIKQLMKSDWKNPEGRAEDRPIMKTGEERGDINQMMKSGQLSQQPLKFFDPLLSPITEYEMGSPMDDKEAKNEEQMWCSPGSELAEASESSGPNKIFFKINFLLFNK